MDTLPPEIQVQLLSYLNIVDLVQLSRTGKAIRAIVIAFYRMRHERMAHLFAQHQLTLHIRTSLLAMLGGICNDVRHFCQVRPFQLEHYDVIRQVCTALGLKEMKMSGLAYLAPDNSVYQFEGKISISKIEALPATLTTGSRS